MARAAGYVRNGQAYNPCLEVERALILLDWADGLLAGPDTKILHFGEYVSKHEIAQATVEKYEDFLVEYIA